MKHIEHGSQASRNILYISKALYIYSLQDILASSSTLSTTAALYFHSLRSLSFVYNLTLLTFTLQRPKQNLCLQLITMHLTQLLLLASATLTVATPYHSWKHEYSWDGEDDCTAEEESPSSTSPAGLSPPGPTAPTSVSSGPTAIAPSQSALPPVEPAPVGSATAVSSSASSSAAAPVQSTKDDAAAAAAPSSSSAASAPPPASSALIATFTESVPLSLPQPSRKSTNPQLPDTEPATPSAPATATAPPPPAASIPTPASTPPPPKPSTVPAQELAPAPPAACATNSPR